MIRPIYFPFTYVPQWAAQAMAAAFRHFCVYQPSGRELPAEMQTWQENNMLDVCVPEPKEGENFARAVREFQRFARLHADDKNLMTAAFTNRQGAVPFFNDTSASQIIAELKRDKTAADGPTVEEMLWRARIFLEFANEFDQQNVELQRELADTNRRSEDLFRNISGGQDAAPPVTRLTTEIKVDDPCEYMAQDRLQAWIRLYLTKPVDSGLLVTTSPSVYYSMIDSVETAEKLFESENLLLNSANDDSFFTWRETFLQRLKNWIESDRPPADDTFDHEPQLENQAARFRLTLYRLPGCRPVQLLTRFLKKPRPDEMKSDQSADIQNTLIALVLSEHSDR